MTDPASRSPRWGLGVLALALFGIGAIGLAAPGTELVPGAAEGSERWVTGAFGSGLDLDPGVYLALLYVSFAAYLGILACARSLGGRTVALAIGVAVTGFALAPPLLSLDVFSYISYARLGVEHGLNPYQSVPAAIPSDPAASRVDDWRFAVSVYGPLFTLGTYPLGALGASGALWSLKAAAGLAVLGVTALTARLAAIRGIEPLAAAAVVGLNPLVLVHVVGGAHNDGLMALVAMVGVASVVAGREGAAGAAAVAGAAVKVPAALVLPFAALAAPRRRRYLAGALAAAGAIVVVTLAAFGGSAAEALGVAGDNQALSSYYSVPSTASRILDVDPDPVRVGFLALYAGVLAWLLVWTARGGDWVRGAGWGAFGLLLASAYLTPWYLIWALPLAALSRDRVLVGGVLALSAYQLINAVPV